MTRVGVVTFPGACDDRDAAYALRLIGAEPVSLWHEETDLRGCDAVIVPGGFTFGDHLRPGAIASHSPVMGAVRAHAEAGGPVLGICNGFQVLTEVGLLPGVLRPNAGLRFRCQDAELVVERATPWLPGCAAGEPADDPDQAPRRLLVRRRRDPGRAGAERADPRSLRRQPERLGGRRRRRHQPGRERRRPDAPSRARGREADRVDRRADPAPGPARACPGEGGCVSAVSPSPHAAPRPDRPGVRPHLRAARARAEHLRAGRLLVALERALRLQALAPAAAPVPDARRARPPGPGRERRRDRRRRRAGGCPQGGVAQPPLGGRAVPGRGHRGRRHPPRHLRDGRAARGDPRLAALRRAGRPATSDTCSRASSRVLATTATASASPTSAARSTSSPGTQPTAWSTPCASACCRPIA